MSRETMEHLNTNVLVGFTDKRGHAWHYKKGLQGAEDNHYPGAIPVADVQRRLAFEAVPRRVAVEIPCAVENATHLSDDGLPMCWAIQTDRQAIVRLDNDFVMGMFKDGYRPHQINEWLIESVSTILGDTLAIGSAGLLREGAVAWVQVEVPDNIQTPEGVVFRPNLLACTSFDGSIATQFKRTITNVVCDNTMEAARSEVGQLYKIKHSKYSGFKLKDAREALAIVETVADDFAAEVTALCATTVTDTQWFKFLDSYAPTEKDNERLTGRSLTMALNKQDTLRRLWVRDERVSPWKNTAWGVVQAVNTYGHHEQTVRGAAREERNMLNAINGITAKADDDALALLGKVLAA